MFRNELRFGRRAGLLAALSTSAALLLATLMPQNVQPTLAAPNFQAPYACGQTWTATHHLGSRALHFDYSPPEQEIGKRILASANGTVSVAGSTSTGRTVKISHSGGYETLYTHLSSINVAVGQTVTRGQVLGVVGSSGTDHVHLHYEQRLNGAPVAVVFDGVLIDTFDYSRRVTSNNC
ncbi:MAG: M23 family metallopeptidase [Chloroflexi bacterium]|nr:M23 family metallopeptidase [Chloroflexota bacterium]